jgi:WD40 repeat protein
LLGFSEKEKAMHYEMARLFFCLGVMVTAFGASTPLQAVEITGKLLAIDPAGQWVTLERSNGASTRPVTLDIRPGAVEGKSLSLGVQITVDFDPESESVRSIVFSGKTSRHPLAGSVFERAGQRLVMDVAFHPDGKQIFYETNRCIVQCARTDKRITGIYQVRHPCPKEGHFFLTSLDVSPDGRLFASSSNGGSVCICDISGPRPAEWAAITENRGIVEPVRFSPDSKMLATAERASGITRVFDVAGASPKMIGTLAPLEGDVWSVAFSPDSMTLVTGVWCNEAEPPYGKILAWDLEAATPSARTIVRRLGGIPRSIQYLPNGRSVVFGIEGVVHQVGLVSGEAEKVLDCYPTTEPVIKLDISSDGKHLAVGGRASPVKLFDLDSGKELDRLEGVASVQGLTVSPDGQAVLIGSKDRKVRVWFPKVN